RGLHRGDDRLFHPAVSGYARSRLHLSPDRASGAIMKYDWSVIWQYREQLAEGVLITVLLTVITMAASIPGGIAVMLLRQSAFRPLRWLGTSFVEFFRNLPLILLIYWAFYVLPIL